MTVVGLNTGSSGWRNVRLSLRRCFPCFWGRALQPISLCRFLLHAKSACWTGWSCYSSFKSGGSCRFSLLMCNCLCLHAKIIALRAYVAWTLSLVLTLTCGTWCWSFNLLRHDVNWFALWGFLSSFLEVMISCLLLFVNSVSWRWHLISF